MATVHTFKTKVNVNHPKRFYSIVRAPQILHHEWIIEGKVLSQQHNQEEPRPESYVDHTVVFLHGLLGNGKNLRAPAKRITSLDPSIGVLNLDLRGHGMSHDAHCPTVSSSSSLSSSSSSSLVTIQDCAHDVIHTVQHLGLSSSKSPVACVGHSFGGRVALSYHHTLLFPPRNNEMYHYNVHPPKHCWILDSVPGAVNSSVASVIQALDSIQPLTIQSKQELVTILTKEKKLSRAIAMWMTTNVRNVSSSSSSTTTNTWEFTFDLNLAKEILKDFPKQDCIQMISDIVTSTRDDYDNDNSHNDNSHNDMSSSSSSSSSRVHLVMAGLNQDWTPEIMTALTDIQKKSNRLDLVKLKHANHWVHVDDLDGLIDVMKDELIF